MEGENAKCLNYYNGGAHGLFARLSTVKFVEFGKGAQIEDYTFYNATNLETITLYLTEEQAQDRSKIPTSWQANVPNAIFTVRDETDTEKIIWDVTYTEPEVN